jgi:hypothetical protein
MANEKRLDALQDEIKLLKGELKNSLASVREYLLNMELPSSEFSTILAALSGDGSGNGEQKITLNGNVGNKPEETDTSLESETESEVANDLEAPPEDEDLIDVGAPEGELPEDLDTNSEELGEEEPMEDGNPEDVLTDTEEMNPEDMMTEETEEETPAEEMYEEEPEETIEEIEEPETEAGEELAPEAEELPFGPIEEGQPMDYTRTSEINSSVPKVNMLANLINWVARAKKEIGYEQLSTFLEVYGVSGHLAPELKEVILHLAEITQERPEGFSESDVWSQSMLSLHGILTGGDAPLNPVIPSWKETADDAENELAEEEIIEIDKNKDKPVKLKLVFPNGNGSSKEFCVNLTPDEDGGKQN